MYVNYDEMPDSSRVWIYQSDRSLEPNDQEKVAALTEAFLNNWKRHGQDLKASYLIKYDYFIVLLVDENHTDVSGCAIDASVNLIKTLENDLSVSLTNKLKVSFRDGANINIVSLPEFKSFANLGKITNKTLVFNNLVNTKEDFEALWEVPADKSWHARFVS